MNKIALLFPFILFAVVYTVILWIVHVEERHKATEQHNHIIKEESTAIKKPNIISYVNVNTVESLAKQRPLRKEEERKLLINPNIIIIERNQIAEEPLCGLISNRTDVTASADVRGNLGPADVVLSEKVDDWLKDRWQAAVDMTGRPIPGPHWVQVNLGRPYHICGVVIDWEDGYSDHWQVVGRRSPYKDGVEQDWMPLFNRNDAQMQSKRRHIVHDVAYRNTYQQPNLNNRNNPPGHTGAISNVNGIYPPEYANMIVSKAPALQIVRLNIRRPSTQWGSSIWRLQIYGFESKQTTTTTT